MLGSLGYASSKSEDQLYLVGQGVYKDGFWGETVKQFSLFLREYPKSQRRTEAMLMLAEALRQENNCQAAAGYYKTIVEENPGFKLADKAWYRLGECSYKLGKYAEAEAAYHSVWAGFPDSELKVPALLGEGESLYIQKKYQEAKAAYGECSKLSSGEYRRAAGLGLGWAYYQLGKFEEAAQEFAQLTSGQASDSIRQQALFQQAKAYYLAKDYGQALTGWEEFARRFPESSLLLQAIYNAAYCDIKLEQPAKARQRFERFVEAYPKHELTGAAWYELGKLYYAAPDYAKAGAAYQKAAAILGDEALAAESAYWQAESLSRRGKVKEAAARYEELCRKYPKQLQWVNLARFRSAEIYVYRQEWKKAKAALKAITKSSRDEELVKKAEEMLSKIK